MPKPLSNTVNIEEIQRVHAENRKKIRERLAEFESVWMNGTDARIWEEMVYCFFTGGCSAKMGLRSVSAVQGLLENGGQPEIAEALAGVHRYPNARSRYVVQSREFLREHCGMRLRAKLESFDCGFERRDWLAREKGIKGLGYKEASHFLRNIGFSGYAILDKHVLRCLHELKIIDDPKPPNTRARYLRVEEKLKQLAKTAQIDFDELDLVLWSMKTGEILK
ncbi:MAG: N-glycosylase/DNA lyase [Acidobacteria bacterium]|nr:N-glycosylase/DNA lyase [Acidobacteriota bacterium]